MSNTNQQSPQNNSDKPKPPVRIFKPIDLTAVRKKARASKPVESAKRILKTKVKISKNYDHNHHVMDFDTFLKSQPGSVQQYLNECHPDVTKFIKENEAYSIKTTPGSLIVLTRNKFRVEISNINNGKRRVKILDKRGEVLFNDITQFTIKKEDK